MARYDFRAQRLYVDHELVAGAVVELDSDQNNYLRNVLRLQPGDAVLAFNGSAGEWRATLRETGRRSFGLEIGEQTRAQEDGPDIFYLFAPLKRARLDYLVQKATEMGVGRLVPVLTRRTVADRVNTERMRANAIEAAEQCGILRIPEVAPPERLERVLQAWQPGRHLIFCDEDGEARNPLAALGALPPGPAAVLVGPEGGFDEAERELLLARPEVLRLSLGPRILRADTAAVAALALVNAVLGDWR